MALNVDLSWSFSGTCDGFHVYRKYGAFQYNSAIATLPNTALSYLDTSSALVYGITYQYAVTAFNQAGDSTLKEVSVTLTVPVPQAVDTLLAIAHA